MVLFDCRMHDGEIDLDAGIGDSPTRLSYEAARRPILSHSMSNINININTNTTPTPYPQVPPGKKPWKSPIVQHDYYQNQGC